jgi:hypothetical protein
MPEDLTDPNPYQSPAEFLPTEAPRGGKQRHGCATAYLILMIVVNAVVGLQNFRLGIGGNVAPAMPNWPFPVLGLFGVLNVVFAVALLRWKKWGFYGFVACAIVVAVINFMFTGLGALLGLTGVAVLYAVLQIGGKRSVWSQLE